MSLLSTHPKPLHFVWRASPDDRWTELNTDLVEWPAQIRIAAEEGLNEFRAGQINLALSELRTTYNIAGGDEIAVFQGQPSVVSKPRWAGTVDPAKIIRDEISHRLSFTVLQHGSLLNTIFAGLPDWTLDTNGEIVYDFTKAYRWRGTADQWVTRYNQDNTFGHNEILTENTEVFYTNTAKLALEDELYRAKFAERIYHFHTANSSLGGVETPFPNVFDGGYENNPGARYTGQFKPHYRPQFTATPEDWDEQGGITHDYGSYLRNPDPILNFKRFGIAELLTEFVNQFNHTARFPLTFNPDEDMILISPSITREIEILQRSNKVSFIDIFASRNAAVLSHQRVFICINWKNDPDTPLNPHFRYSLYYIDNETDLSPIAENLDGYTSNCWPTYSNGMRFLRNYRPAADSSIQLYNLVYTDPTPGPQGFWVNSVVIPVGNIPAVRVFHHQIIENPADFPGQKFTLNRSAQITNTSTGEAVIRDGSYPFEPFAPEQLPQFNLKFDGRTYRTLSGGLTVTGTLFDRVAVDAVNKKLSSLISDLAKLTCSRWFITSDRKLKFISRLAAGVTQNIESASLRRPFQTFTRSFEKESAPSFSGALVIPDPIKQSLTNWYEDNILPSQVVGGNIAVTASDLNEVEIADQIQLTDEPNIGNPAAVKSIDLVGDNTLLITTEQTIEIP